MTADLTVTVPADLVDVVADYHDVASVTVDGVHSCVVPHDDGHLVRFESPRMPAQRKAGAES